MFLKTMDTAVLREFLVVRCHCSLMILVIAGLLGTSVQADDWPTLKHDQRRGGISQEQLAANKLQQEWSWSTPLPPSSAWPDAAKWDAYAKVADLRSMRDYDPVLHPIVVGQQVFLPSNVDDTVRCLNLDDGNLVWQFTADAPVRIAPSVFQDRVYFGCDDGFVYCLSSANGELSWKRKVVDQADSFINDGRICSSMPVRTGVLIDEQRNAAIVAASLFPWQNTVLAALDLETGEVSWSRDLGTGWTLEGAMLLSPKHIIAPQGRSAPQLFDRESGKPSGALPGGGGSFVLLTEDEQVFHGPGNKSGWITTSDTSKASSTDGKIEKIASFDRGTAVIVQDRIAYLLDQQRIAAFDRVAGEFLWASPCPAPHELILVGDTLFAGGNDEVWAFNRETGMPVWKGDVDGRALGLAAANGKLLVATDSGKLIVFHEGDTEQPNPVVPESSEELHVPAADVDLTVSSIDASSLLQRWVFHRSHFDGEGLGTGGKIKSLATDGLPAPLAPGAFIVEQGAEQALLLDGRIELEIAKDYHDIKVPATAITVETVVRIDKPLDWGGLICVTQDNGDYEKGWILGYRNDKFGFAVNGNDGPDRLVWVTDETGIIQPGVWYHVVGTYDGQEAKLYVNGKLVASSTEPKGSIRYPKAAALHVGAYKDDDEHFIATGMLNEICLLERAYTAEEVERRASEILVKFPAPEPIVENVESKQDYVPPSRGPVLRFIERGVAEVTWATKQPQRSALKLLEGEGLVEIENAEALKFEHRALIKDLATRSVAQYQISHLRDGQAKLSPEYECDTHFDYCRPELPETTNVELLAELVRPIREVLVRKERRGLALVIGCNDSGLLAEGLCREFGLDVVVVESSEAKVDEARKRLLAAGIYGRPINIQRQRNLDDLHLPTRAFDVVLCAGDDPVATELSKVAGYVQPGGSLILSSSVDCQSLEDLGYVVVNEQEASDWQALLGPRLDGAASWTHMYGTPENTAYAGETLSGVRGIDDLRVAWAGRPGPRYQSDRGNRKPSPLASGGRLYLQGLYRTIAMDAYNGTILWTLELPEVVRFNVPRDCSNWCVDQDNVFIASEERCMIVDGATGEIQSEYEVHDGAMPADGDSLNWGYVARQSNALIGTGVRPSNTFTEYWGKEAWYDSKDGEHAKKVCSDNIFSVHPATGKMAWEHRGLIVNPTITMSNDRIYFIECRAEALINGDSRRLDGDLFWNNLFLVSLDLRSGKIDWEVPAKPMPGESAFYMVYTDGKLLIQTSQGGKFALYAIDANTGAGTWRGLYEWQADHHGKHLSRPAIVDGTIYLRPLTLSLEDGSIISKEFPEGHQCGTYTCSANALFMRAGSLAIWDRQTSEATRWDRLRPDCWISTIPAEGMLLSPEGGGGCSCGGWIETSIGFAPKWDMLLDRRDDR